MFARVLRTRMVRRAMPVRAAFGGRILLILEHVPLLINDELEGTSLKNASPRATIGPTNMINVYDQHICWKDHGFRFYKKRNPSSSGRNWQGSVRTLFSRWLTYKVLRWIGVCSRDSERFMVMGWSLKSMQRSFWNMKAIKLWQGQLSFLVNLLGNPFVDG